jgi:hypothetical protein
MVYTMNKIDTVNDINKVKWSVRCILDDDCKYRYAVMYLSIYNIWTDRVYCEDELTAHHICDLLNIAEGIRNE